MEDKGADVLALVNLTAYLIIQADVREATLDVIVSGDFNTHSPAWGLRQTDPRGEALMKIVESLNLVALNDGKVPIFPRAYSFLVLTLATKEIMRTIGSWKADGHVHGGGKNAIDNDCRNQLHGATELLRSACNGYMPKGSYKWGNNPCMRSRRKLRKLRTRNDDCASKLEEYKHPIPRLSTKNLACYGIDRGSPTNYL
ncbi:hypothetical protein QTP88_010552 [Uroleucon formosanum]